MGYFKKRKQEKLKQQADMIASAIKEGLKGSSLYTEKTYSNTTKKTTASQVKDAEFWGGDSWKLLSKASSEGEKWMKSTKAMYIINMGCLVQVTTQQGGEIAESVTFVPGVKIKTVTGEDNRTVIRRDLIKI